MRKKPTVTLPLEPLHDLMAWWKAFGIRGMIIGGLAIAARARPRVTRDVDAVVLLPESTWPAFLKSSGQFHFSARERDPLGFARTSRVFLLRHDPSKILVDISLGNLPFEHQAIARATSEKLGRLRVPVATVEDLIVLKAVAHRELDFVDIHNLLDINPKVNETEILKQVDHFAELLEMPEIYLDLEHLLRRHRTKKPRAK